MVFRINLITSFNYSDTDDKNFDFFVLHVAFMLGRCEIRSSLVIGLHVGRSDTVIYSQLH